MSASNKTEAAAHPYLTIREAVEAERAAREARDHDEYVRRLTWGIAKRAGLA